MHSTEYNGCKKKESKWLVIWNGGSSIILVNLELELHYFLFGGNNLFPWLRAQRRNFLILKCCSAKKGALVTWFTLWEVQMFSHSWVDIVEKKEHPIGWLISCKKDDLNWAYPDCSFTHVLYKQFDFIWSTSNRKYSADPPRRTLFINQPLQYFSLTKPASFSQVSDQRTGPYKGAWRQLQHCMIKFLRYLHTNWMNLDKSIHI